MRRQPGSLLLLAALLVPAAVLVPARLARADPGRRPGAERRRHRRRRAGLAGADVFDMRYYLTDADGNRGRTMTRRTSATS
jgi:hypothetical protein